jgi:pantoate--beta-alanine ligase
MRVVHTNSELAQAVAEARSAGQRIGFVPTMGALHAGHLSLVEIAAARAEFVVVSIFVNPLQFAANEDFGKYPRTLDADTAALEHTAADLLYAPNAEEVYRQADGRIDTSITHHAGRAGDDFEGAVRPGHFDGMLTVVARLFDLVKPDVAVFGAKDAQQLFLVRELAAQSYPGLEIIAAPIVREESGLALSSRNRYLSASERIQAESLSMALRGAARQSENGPCQALAAARDALAQEPAIRLDYLALVDKSTFEPVPEDFVGAALLLIAARVGNTRLLDNQDIDFR